MHVAHHHHLRMSDVMAKAQDWFGRVIVVAAVAAGAIALITALNSHGSVTW